MAAPEQVGIQTEEELVKLQAQIDSALGEQAKELPPYPTHFFDASLLPVEQLRWMNQALSLIIGDDSTDEGEEQGPEESDDPGEPDTTSEEPESTDDTEDEPETEPEPETPAKETTAKRTTAKK